METTPFYDIERVEEIILVDINTLKFADYNPRQLTEKQYKDLQNSIEKFGLVDPIIVNRNKDRKNIIIGGHQRVRVAKELGVDKVPIVTLDLNAEKEKELNIRLNKNNGEWNYDNLANFFDMDNLLDWGFENYELGIEDKSTANNVEEEWEGMPEYSNDDMTSHRRLIVHFRNDEDVVEFTKLMKQNITDRTKSLWYPSLEKETFSDEVYVDES